MLHTSSIPAPIMLLEHYHAVGLTTLETFLVLQFLACKGNVNKMAKNMKQPEEEIKIQLNNLLEKRLLNMEMTTTPEGKMDMVYTLDPLFDKLAVMIVENAESEKMVNAKDIVSTFEQEFGRALSGTELQMIGDWIQKDKYAEEIILMALREAVLSQALNLKYIDRILLSWERKNIKTAQQVEQERQLFYKPSAPQQSPEVDDELAEILSQNFLQQ